MPIPTDFRGQPYRFFTMPHARSCTRLPYWLADSVCVSVVVGYVLRACVVALECFPLEAGVTKLVADVADVAHVAVVAIVIDRKTE